MNSKLHSASRLGPDFRLRRHPTALVVLEGPIRSPKVWGRVHSRHRAVSGLLLRSRETPCAGLIRLCAVAPFNRLGALPAIGSIGNCRRPCATQPVNRNSRSIGPGVLQSTVTPVAYLLARPRQSALTPDGFPAADGRSPNVRTARGASQPSRSELPILDPAQSPHICSPWLLRPPLQASAKPAACGGLAQGRFLLTPVTDRSSIDQLENVHDSGGLDGVLATMPGSGATLPEGRM